MKRHGIVTLLGGVLLLFLSGCAPRYKALPLEHFKAVPDPLAQSDPVSFGCYFFTSYDCKRYLGKDVLLHGYQPIYLTITNNTSRSFRFSRSNINIPTIDARLVARKVHTNTVGRVAGYGIASLFLAPLLIPAVVDGVRASTENKKLDDDYAMKALNDQVLYPYETIQGILFATLASVDPHIKLVLVSLDKPERVVLSL